MRKQIFRRDHGKLFARGEPTLYAFNLHGWPVIEMESPKMRTGENLRASTKYEQRKCIL